MRYVKELVSFVNGDVRYLLDSGSFRNPISDQCLREFIRNNTVQEEELVNAFTAALMDSGSV